MSVAKYQPIQDAVVPTSPRPLIAGASVGPGQHVENGGFPFIRSSRLDHIQGTELRNDVLPSVWGTEVGPSPVDIVVGVPRSSHPNYRLQLLQQWECVVRSVSTDEMLAVMYDLNDPSKPEEEAPFPLEEVPDSDRAFVEPGAVFYWSIGYRTSATGQKDRISQIRFRRLPPLTATERREADREASEFEELLDDSKR
jgi:hypothetical protein